MPLDPTPLLDKKALVTGAARGIGQAIAVRLAEAGADVALMDRLDLSETVAAVEATGRPAHPFAVDLCKRHRVDIACDAVLERLEGLDVVVCNAGIVSTSSLVETSDEEWDQVMETNLTSGFRIVRRLWTALQVSTGRVVLIGSRAARTGGNNAGPAYVASKGAIHSLVIALARDGAASGVRVNGVAPGPTSTTMTVLPSYQDSAVATPLGRLGDPGEIADAVLFLASDASGFVTGTVLNVSGGAVMG